MQNKVCSLERKYVGEWKNQAMQRLSQLDNETERSQSVNKVKSDQLDSKLIKLETKIVENLIIVCDTNSSLEHPPLTPDDNMAVQGVNMLLML